MTSRVDSFRHEKKLGHAPIDLGIARAWPGGGDADGTSDKVGKQQGSVDTRCPRLEVRVRPLGSPRPSTAAASASRVGLPARSGHLRLRPATHDQLHKLARKLVGVVLELGEGREGLKGERGLELSGRHLAARKTVTKSRARAIRCLRRRLRATPRRSPRDQALLIVPACLDAVAVAGVLLLCLLCTIACIRVVLCLFVQAVVQDHGLHKR